MSDDEVVLRELDAGEEKAACDLARQVFDEAVAKDLPPGGVEEFYRYAEAGAMAERRRQGHLAFGASVSERLVGVAEVLHAKHISMLFVDERHRGTGVGRQLLLRALTACVGSDQSVLEVTVNSALDAVPFYERMGFCRSGPEQVVNGLRFVPMAGCLGADLVLPVSAGEANARREE